MKTIRTLGILTIVLAISAEAFGAGGGDGTTTTTYSTSTDTIYNTSYSQVTLPMYTFSTELLAFMQGGPVLYDQTFNLPFLNPQVQAAIGTAQGVLTTNGAYSILGPTLLTDVDSLVSSVTQTSPPVIDSTYVTSSSTTYIGPQTISIGDNQSQSFTIAPGAMDVDTLYTTFITQDITTTTTDTILTTEVYDLVGDSDATTTPEPGTMLLMGIGALGGAYMKRRSKRA